VAELVPFRLEVEFVVGVGGQAEGELFHDSEAVSVEPDDLFRVVGEEADLAHAEVMEDLGAHAVVAEVGGESEFLVGFHGVAAVFLEFVGMDFGGESDAASFLSQVEEHSSLGGDERHGGVQLAAAIAAPGAEDIAGEAFRVHPDQNGPVGDNRTVGQGEMVRAVGRDAVEVALEVAVIGGQLDGFLAFDELLVAAAVFDDLCNRAGLESMAALVVSEFPDAGHGAILVHDFADHAGGGEAGHAREVDGGFGMPGASEDAVVHGLQGEDVAGLDEGGGSGCRVGEEADGAGAVGGGDAGADSVGGIHRDGECGSLAFAISARHRGEIEILDAFPGDGGTNQAPPVGRHEGHHLGAGESSGPNKVGLVLPRRIIDNDDEAAGRDLGHDFFNRTEFEGMHGGRVNSYASWRERKAPRRQTDGLIEDQRLRPAGRRAGPGGVLGAGRNGWRDDQESKTIRLALLNPIDSCLHRSLVAVRRHVVLKAPPRRGVADGRGAPQGRGTNC